MSTRSAAMSVRKQIEAMIEDGFDMEDQFVPVFRDERATAIAALEPGDTLVVASAACLGTVASDVLDALKAIGDRGAAVHDLNTNEMISWSEEAQAVLSFATRADQDNRKARVATMRKARAASGNLGGLKAVEWDQKRLDMLKALFKENTPRHEMADKLGVSRPTIQRKLRELGLVGRRGNENL